MLNFRKLRQDYAPSLLKEGRHLFDKKMVLSAKIVKLAPQTIRLSCRVLGSYDNTYESEVEIDRNKSTTIDSDCNCPYKYDCQHLASVLYYLEEHLDEILVAYSKETDLEHADNINEEEKATLLQTFKAAEVNDSLKKGKKYQKDLLDEYINASQTLGQSPFFLPNEELIPDKAELVVVFSPLTPQEVAAGSIIEIHLALRLPFRSKPLNIPNLKEFLDAVRYLTPIYINSKRYFFTLESFEGASRDILGRIMDFVRFREKADDYNPRHGQISPEAFGTLLVEAYEIAMKNTASVSSIHHEEGELSLLPCLCIGTIEEPLRYSPSPAAIQVALEYLVAPTPKLLLDPKLVLGPGDASPITLEDACLFECAQPCILHKKTFYRLPPEIKRKHLRNLNVIREVTIPEPLFGTFVENSLAELMRFAEVTNREVLEKFVTLPFVGTLGAECDIHYLNGELEATLHFIYDTLKIPAATSQLDVEQINAFATEEGVLARNLTKEQKIIDDLFQDFVYESSQGVYSAKTDKIIVEFMTEVIPRNQHRVKFNCPENLLEQFIYDDSTFELKLRESDRVDVYEIDLKVNGNLNGTTVDLLWECISSKRGMIELTRKKSKKKNEPENSIKNNKILVLDLEKLVPVVQIFDEIGIKKLDDHKELRPLWSLVSLNPAAFNGLPIKFSITKKLEQIQQQMLGNKPIKARDIPTHIKADMRPYQIEGIHWLHRLRSMHLNGILADDMGLGKTLQAISAITQYNVDNPKGISIIVCPTSLVYNWKEEFGKFNAKLKILPVDGTPAQRKKLQTEIKKHHVIITSYSLLQKDIDFYKTIPFGYAILDEAQHIKNRGTRNAKSVKMIQATHRLILTGTPIENSLDELWSLFDFLMPGLLSNYDRFFEKYIRNPNKETGKDLDGLRKKVSPFILRRMKKDVLSELPPVSEIIYHCNLSAIQKELYQSYAKSAREELSQLVKKEGFDRVQIHVLATLTRLKQICCHPAIFAKDKAEAGDSSKYDMLLELLQTLIEGKHKTVIFSQYTRMLNIMRTDLQNLGIPFEYLDGSSKNRLEIVNQFNQNENVPIFLVSLKAGGTGLNLVGADTVIHYDMWWNPAVESQATDRVHRIGQQNSVSAYKLITLDTIEEKILQLHERKKGYMKKIISCDEEAIAKLTWEEVLELLKD